MKTRAARILAVVGSVVATATAACSLLVSSAVPDFACSSADPDACPNGTTCDLTSRICVKVTSDAGESPNVSVGVVETGSEADSNRLPRALGSKCRVDNECQSGLCGSSTILTTTITEATGPICSTPCCTSAECPDTFVCFNGGTGGGYCVPAALAQRQSAKSASKGGGELCSGNDECRSGLCQSPDAGPARCLDTCCTESECNAGAVCRLKQVSAPGPSHVIWACALPEATATKPPGESCTASSECTSDSCVGYGASRICRPPCASTATCKAANGFANGRCGYGSDGPDSLKLCFAASLDAGAPPGMPCIDKSMCQSNYCDGELKACANVCARDADCAASEACRPAAVSTPYLRCVPKLKSTPD